MRFASGGRGSIVDWDGDGRYDIGGYFEGVVDPAVRSVAAKFTSASQAVENAYEDVQEIVVTAYRAIAGTVKSSLGHSNTVKLRTDGITQAITARTSTPQRTSSAPASSGESSWFSLPEINFPSVNFNAAWQREAGVGNNGGLYSGINARLRGDDPISVSMDTQRGLSQYKTGLFGNLVLGKMEVDASFSAAYLTAPVSAPLAPFVNTKSPYVNGGFKLGAAVSPLQFLGGGDLVASFGTKQAARQALDGPLGAAANRFFRDAAKNSRDFRIINLAGGIKRFEYFSAARNAGYGKLYIQEVESTGIVVREFKETLGPSGVIETKWVHGGS